MSEATDTKTEVKTDETMGNVVSITAKPAQERTVWDDATIELIKKQVCPAGIPEGEFKLFIMKCRQTGMNPLIGEAFCVPRSVKVKVGNVENWVTQFVFQAAEQGMETRADRFEDFQGLRGAAVYQNDKIDINAAEGTVAHTFSPVGDRGALMGAWAIAYRKGRKTPVEYVLFKEYAQSTAQWNGKPATMIVKCARAAALRRAYPQAFAGIYVDEEIEVNSVERDEGAPPPPSKMNPTSRTESVLNKVQQAAGTAPVASPPRPAQPSPSQQTVDAPPPSSVDEHALSMGPFKNKPIAGLSAEELSEAISVHATKVTEMPRKSWFAKAEWELKALRAEQEKRVAEITGEEAPF